jgi:outer membrane protein
MKNLPLLPLLLLLLTFSSLAQSVAPPSSVLEQYIRQGLVSNLALRNESLSVEKSLQLLYQAHALYLPTLTFRANYTLAQGGRRIDLPVGDLLNPVYGSLNQLTASDRFPQISNVSIQLAPNNFHETKLRLVQSLFNSDIYYNYRAQKELVTAQKARKQVYENELKGNIATAYYQYLQATEALHIFKDTRPLLEELLRVNTKLVGQQMATKDVVYSAQAELDKLDEETAQAEKNVQSAQAYFNFLLNRDLQSEIIIDHNIFFDSTQVLSLPSLKEKALSQRKELEQLEAGRRASQQAIGLSKASRMLPNVVLVGDLGYEGFGYTFNSRQEIAFMQVGLTWDLFKGGARQSKIQQARIEAQQTDTRYEEVGQQIQLQVTQAYYDWIASQKAFRATAASLSSAHASFDIIRRKYSQQQVILLEYLQARNRLTTAQLAHAIARYNVLMKDAELAKTLNL